VIGSRQSALQFIVGSVSAVHAILWSAVSALFVACGSRVGADAPRTPAGSGLPPELVDIAERFWTEQLRADPVQASVLGIAGYDALLPDVSPARLEQARRELRDLLARADSLNLAMARSHWISREVLRWQLQAALLASICDLEFWAVDHLWGPHVWLLNLGKVQKVGTAVERANYLARLRAFSPFVDQEIANLRTGLRRGLVAPRLNVDRTLARLDDLSATEIARDPLVEAADRAPAPEREAFRQQLVHTVERGVRPAFARYREVLAQEVLPRARTEPGLSALPNGAACYRALIKKHTTEDRTPDELHVLGLQEMARIRQQMQQVASRLFPGIELDDVLQRLRDDPASGFASREQVETAARAAIGRALDRLPDAFSDLPQTRLEVRALEPHLEKDAPMAYYQEPAADRSRPGIYYVNTYLPAERPRYTAEVLAFHEGVPGHHVQIALAQENHGVPEFRRHANVTVFIEGWALYAERLSDELGLYSGDRDRLGMLSFDAWRAARLVVDTGMHALGWSRAQAIEYMLANTASSRSDVENEVDRYITWPGQALAYKVGQLEIGRLRSRAEEILGGRFDLREFHRRVLRNGAVPLSVLAAEVERWIAGD
jgi:uncharacterized protein (DUF885 family)